jgi:hypothetical protein
MSDSAISSRFAARGVLEVPDGNTDVPENLGCFGWLRGIRDRALMLELRKATGNVLAIGYAWIDRIEFEPSEGITIFAAGQRIMIRGKQLNGPREASARLFEGLTRHRIAWVQELSLSEKLAGDASSCIVESIEW